MRSLIVNQKTDKLTPQYLALDNAVKQSPWQAQTINEVVMEHQHDEISLLAPTLVKLSQQGRWIVLVGASKQVIKTINQIPSLDSARILLVHPDDQTDSLWAVEQALMSGNSSAVLGWPGAINSRDRKRLQLAAKRTSALAFIFNEKSQATPSLSLSYDNQTSNQFGQQSSFH